MSVDNEREEVGGASAEPERQNSNNSSLSDMIDKVLANPQIISAVASALSASRSAPSGESGAEQKVGEQAPRTAASESVKTSLEGSGIPDGLAEKLPEIMAALGPVLKSSAPVSSNAVASDRRTVLLSAIKPYLSSHRSEAIDYIIKLARVSEVLKNMN